jgi:hypothetical protein
MTYPKRLVLKANAPLIVTPFPNGGWTIEQTTGERMMPASVGAFTSAYDMLAALQVALLDAPASDDAPAVPAS